MTPAGERLLVLLRERLADDHVLREDLGDLGDCTWTEADGAIEADLGVRTVRFQPSSIVITNKQFNSSKRIPLE